MFRVWITRLLLVHFRLMVRGAAQEVRIEDCTSVEPGMMVPWEDTLRLMPPLLELMDMFNIVCRRSTSQAIDSDLLKGPYLLHRLHLLSYTHWAFGVFSDQLFQSVPVMHLVSVDHRVKYLTSMTAGPGAWPLVALVAYGIEAIGLC